LANFLSEFTQATSVYIGKQVVPKKKIKEDDDDTAHLDPEANKIIHFMHTSENSSFMID